MASFSFLARTIIERAIHGAPVADPGPAPVHLHDNIRGFGYRDIDSMQRRDRSLRHVASRGLLVVHQTGVEFGVAPSLLRIWRARLANVAASGDDSLRGILADGHDWTAVLERPDMYARRLALASRFWTLPYHYVITRCGMVLHNAPLTWRTHHAHLGNDGLGVAFEGRWPGRGSGGTPFSPSRFIAQLHAVIAHARKAGAPLAEISAHRCFAAPSARGADPGEALWRDVVRPAAKQARLEIDYDLRRGSGRPIPLDWDDDATHDWHGRRR